MKLYPAKPEDSILRENKENLRVKDFYKSHGLISQGLQGEGMGGWAKAASSQGVSIGKGAR